MTIIPVDTILPGESGLTDDVSSRLDGIGCLAIRLNWIVDPAARDLCLEAIANAVDSMKPKGDEKQGFNRFRVVQAGQEQGQ